MAVVRLATVSPTDASTPWRFRLSGVWITPLWFAGALAALTAALVGGIAGALAAAPVGLASWLVIRAVLQRRATHTDAGDDGLRLAASWDLLAASLRAGLPAATAVRAVADGAPPFARDALRNAGDLLALGATADEAWALARKSPGTAEFARAACRSEQSGGALAEVASGLASQLRAGVADQAEAQAQRAAVLITGPLGLCFLPAFLCLGVVPVVLGLASQLTFL